MHISDHLSRSALSTSENTKLEEYDIFSTQEENELMQDIEEIDPDLYHDVSDRTLLQIREATVSDDNLMTLAEMVTYGWPDDKSQVPPNIREYWPYRDELAVQRGILYRGTRVIVPTAMREDMLTKIHFAHRGTDGCIKAAHDTLYWPSIHNDIKYICENCSACQEMKPEQTREPMQSQPIPKRR